MRALDSGALEARTQTIGRELFAAARQHHAHLSALNQWTAQVLSWCLSDPAVKANVLRFIDVLPSLQTPADIARHVREYFPTDNHRLPAALRLGAGLARPSVLTRGALAGVVRQSVEQVARQFIAEAHTEGAARLVQAMAAQGRACSLDVLGEQVLSEADADRYMAQCRALLQQAVQACRVLPPRGALNLCGPAASVSVKPSALTPRFDPISPASSVERAWQRVLPLWELAQAGEATLHLDMEQYELRDVTLDLAKRLVLHAKAGAGGAIGVVVQAYLRDAQASTAELIAWLRAHECVLTVRLVKGAYWDYEVVQARQRHWTPPVYEAKAATDAAFEQLTATLLQATPWVTTAIASHNVRSIAHAMAVAESFELKPRQLEFQVLYGMGDALAAAIGARGYPVRVYTPIGELLPGMAYLVRRLLENTANESFLRQELTRERDAEGLLQPPRVTAESFGTAPAPVLDWVPEPLADFSKPAVRDALGHMLAQTALEPPEPYPLLIGQEPVTTTETLRVRNPAHPAHVLGHVSVATPEHATRALSLASAAQPAWGATPARVRVALLREAARRLCVERTALTALVVFEVGKTWREADVEVVEAIEYLEYYSAHMLRLAEGRPIDELPGEHNQYRYGPRGVAAVIAPWNFPLAILTGMAAAALAAGNAVILKPAEQSSLIAAQLARVLREAGIPPEIVQYLPGPGEQVGAALVHDARTHLVMFTGSRAVGLSILEACGRVLPGQRFIKHAVTELGGKNAILVDADADLDAVVSGTLRSAFGYAGQKCSAASRLILHAAVYERVLERLCAAADRLVVGDPANPDTDVGPLIDAASQRRLQAAQARAAQVGQIAYAYPASRLPSEGFFVGPVIATEVSPRDALAQEELFGPLLCVFRVRTLEEGLALANDTDYALTGGIYSRSPANIQRALQQFDVGNLYVNRPITGAMVGRQPFGGHRLSGQGTKAGGPDYLLQCLLPKTISTDTTRHGMPLE